METPSDEEELSEVQKRIRAKNKVRQEIADHKTKLRLLKKKYKEGHNVSQDIDGAEGYVEVLKKELISIEEGSHSTFLAAKKTISPKFNIDTKKGKILSKIRTLAKDIRECEAFLSGGDRTREENEDVVNKFLKNRSDFKLLVTHSLLPDQWVNSDGFMFAAPYKTKTDGLFAAVLQKKF